jgi:hypothetical protein
VGGGAQRSPAQVEPDLAVAEAPLRIDTAWVSVMLIGAPLVAAAADPVLDVGAGPPTMVVEELVLCCVLVCTAMPLADASPLVVSLSRLFAGLDLGLSAVAPPEVALAAPASSIATWWLDLTDTSADEVPLTWSDATLEFETAFWAATACAAASPELTSVCAALVGSVYATRAGLRGVTTMLVPLLPPARPVSVTVA